MVILLGYRRGSKRGILLMWCDKNMPILAFLYSYDKWVISLVDECATEIPKLPSKLQL
jgi:hypothetical protein